MIATLKIAGTLQKSSEVMSMVNNLVKLPEISAQMQEMSKEMMRVSMHHNTMSSRALSSFRHHVGHLTITND